MSRLGRQLIQIPSEIKIDLSDDQLKISGPKGELTQSIHPLIKLQQKEATLSVGRKNDTKLAKSLHGTFQRLISNMVKGVSDGFSKKLELVGIGYRVVKQGDKIVLSLGFSHPIEYQTPKNIDITIEDNNKITVSGIDRQLVGQTAAHIRSFRKPEPYKGKGIKYEDEIIRRKAGKTAKTAQA